tara:strand:+ start:1142 stop:2077 length:936 start_codon:yes stop_codon:yes gene_type:complete
MITVASYLMGIPPGNRNLEKPAIINNFIEGVNKVGDKGAVVTGWQPMNTDVAVIQGFVHADSKQTKHLLLRKAVMDNQINRGKRFIIVDANLFLYKDKTNAKGYLRYSYDGIFPTTGEYCYDQPDPFRWRKLKEDLNIEVKDWKMNNGRDILICCQRDGGWSMDGQGVVSWLVKTIGEIRRYSDRPVTVRFHPGDKRVAGHIKQLAGYRIPKLKISYAQHITEDFETSYAVINYNSSPAIASVIEGLPTFVLDPDRSQANGVVHSSLSDLESPREFDRENWLHKLAQCHWTLDELKTGEAWRHLKRFAIKE